MILYRYEYKKRRKYGSVDIWEILEGFDKLDMSVMADNVADWVVDHVVCWKTSEQIKCGYFLLLQKQDFPSR